jgi:putative aldouronate transport system substrate-binding protein
MSQWYKEGLIDQEINRDEANFKSLVSTNVVGALAHLSEYLNQYDSLAQSGGGPSAKYVFALPPKTPDGSDPLVLLRPPFSQHFGITKDAKNPEVAMKWLDIIWCTEEAYEAKEWGIEGVSFTKDSSGQRHYTDFVLNNPSGLDPYNALRTLGAQVTDFTGGYVSDASHYKARNAGSPSVLELAETLKKYRVLPFPGNMLSSAENDIVSRYSPDLSTYRTETITKMLIGETPLSEWDNYVSTLNRLGLAELQKVRQAQYDRGK